VVPAFCLSEEFLEAPLTVFPLMQLLKAKSEHTYKEQMEEPVVQLLEMETNTLKQKIRE
jgi:hypothetical protein